MKNVHHQELESHDIKERVLRELSPLPTQVPQPRAYATPSPSTTFTFFSPNSLN